jgi:sporulation protein YlmC with PRC-barrel domain
MRASELFGLHVIDPSGRHIGDVHDVRLVRIPLGSAGEGLSIDGLVVGPGSIGVRLGYAHGNTRGPWVLKQLFRRRAYHLHFVPWSAVVHRTHDEIHVADFRPEENP